MDWIDLDFVLASPECDRPASAERTGWETVVFELEDEGEVGEPGTLDPGS